LGNENETNTYLKRKAVTFFYRTFQLARTEEEMGATFRELRQKGVNSNE